MYFFPVSRICRCYQPAAYIGILIHGLIPEQIKLLIISNAPFTPVRQTIRRPLQSSVVRFSQNRSDRKYERPFTPSPSSVVLHPSSVKIGPGAILTDDGWRMRTINHSMSYGKGIPHK